MKHWTCTFSLFLCLSFSGHALAKKRAPKSTPTPRTIELSQEELQSLNLQKKKCFQLGLKDNLKRNAITVEGVGTLSLHNIIDGDPSRLAFGIINLNHEGKTFDLALNKVDHHHWAAATTLYGQQATQELRFQFQEQSEEKKIVITVSGDGLSYKSKSYASLEFICEMN